MSYPLWLAAMAVGVAVLFLVAVGRASAQDLRRAVLGTVVWMAVPGALALAGALTFSTLPPTMLILIAVLIGGTIGLARSGLGGRLAAGLPLSVLVAYQGFRIPVELWLHEGSQLGVFPVQMTYSGMNFDIVSGISALIVGWAVHRGIAGRRVVLAWNLVALMLLATIVTVAILSAPVPFRVFDLDPANTYVTGFPGVWLPAVLVQAALLGHLLVFRRLRMTEAGATAPPAESGQDLVGQAGERA